MSEHKAFASLSSGLLARKGDARPAMRRQNFAEMGQDIDDLGWNDMGEEPGAGGASTAAAPSFGGLDDGDDNDRGVLAALGPLAGLSAQKAVQNQIQSVADQAHSVKQQQADIMAHFRIPDGEESDDGADLEDETAEMWDPEAEDDGNIFSGHTDSVAESGGDEDGENLRFTADRYASEEGTVPFADEPALEDAAEDFAPEAEEEFAAQAEVEFEAETQGEAPIVDAADDEVAAEFEAPAFETPAEEEAVVEEDDDTGKVPFAAELAAEEGNNDVTMVDDYIDPASIDLSSLEDEPLELAEEAEEVVAVDEALAEPVDEYVADDEVAEDDILELAEEDVSDEGVLELSEAADDEAETAEDVAEDDVLELAADDIADEDVAIEAEAEEEPANDIVDFASEIASYDDETSDEPFELQSSDEMAEAAAADQDFAEAAELHVEPEISSEDASEAEAVEADAERIEDVAENINVPTVADILPMPAKRAETIRRPRRPRAQPGSKEKAAFTLRLDKQRHLKLRLASAVTGQSAQKILIEALDRMLEEMPELDALADSAPDAGKKAG